MQDSKSKSVSLYDHKCVRHSHTSAMVHLQDEEETYDCLLKSSLYMHNNRNRFRPLVFVLSVIINKQLFVLPNKQVGVSICTFVLVKQVNWSPEQTSRTSCVLWCSGLRWFGNFLLSRSGFKEASLNPNNWSTRCLSHFINKTYNWLTRCLSIKRYHLRVLVNTSLSKHTVLINHPELVDSR
jgi:hypothetical protein